MTITAADWNEIIRRCGLLVRLAIKEAVSGGAIGTPVFRPGLVGSTGDQTFVSVRCDGDVNALSAVNLTNAVLPLGCRVMVMFTPPHGVYVSAVLGAPIAPHGSSTRVIPAGDRTTGSGSYVDVPSETVEVPIVKYRDDTVLHIDIFGTNIYSTGGAATVFLGAEVDDGSTATDYDVAYGDVDSSGGRKPVLGFEDVDGLTAGSYTVTMRVKVGSNTVHLDTAALLMMSVEERMP